ncbi:hypothetical protein MPTK2_3g13910 [Marchantia polymorpha subsp. ruderalis]
MMKKKKKGKWCGEGGCLSTGRRRRDDWSSELEYEKDYEKYGREYEREYARLCELQRSLTPEERSKRSEATSTTFEAPSFSRRYSSFDHFEITEDRLEQELRNVSDQKVEEESDFDVELLEKFMREAEEAENLEAVRKHEEEEKEKARKMREEMSWRKREEEIARRKKEELARRQREEEEMARRRREEEDFARRKREEEEFARRKREQEDFARRKREHEDFARRKREQEDFARRKREQEDYARRKGEQEDIARRKSEEEEFARRKQEDEEIARRKREELARKKMEDEEIARRKREEFLRRRGVEEEIARRKQEEEEQLEGWQAQHDLSWMSFTQQARNRALGVTATSDRIDRIQRTDSERYDASPSVSGRSTWSDVGDISGRRDLSFSGGWQNEWREVEILEEEEQEEEVKLIRNRTRRGKELARDDFDDGTSSSASEQPPDEWDIGKPTVYSFSPLHLGAGFQRRFQRRRNELMSRFEQKLLKAAKVPQSKFYRRLHFAAMVVMGFLGVALMLILFLLYLSFLARVRPPGECENQRIILNFTATRIRLRGGRYLSFREQGVGADRAEHSVVVVHDLLSSRLAGIPGIKASLLEEYKVRLIAYDRPGYGQSDPHMGRNYNTSAYDIVEIADALNLGDKFWVVGFGGGGPHVWAAINYLPERLAGVAMFAPAGNPYVNNMTKEEVDDIWGLLTLRQKWMHSIARRFPALLPTLLQRTAITNSPYVPRNVRLSLGQKDQEWMEQPDVMTAWQEDLKESLQQGCAFPMAEELMMLVNDWGFSLSDLPFGERTAKTIFHHVVGLFAGKAKPKIYEGPIHIWQGTDDQLVPVTINNVAKRLVEQNDLLDLEAKSSPVKLHYLPGEGHFSWFWFCDECHRRIFQTLFRPDATVKAEDATPFSSKGFSVDDYESIVKALGSLKAKHDTSAVEDGLAAAGKTVDKSAKTSARDEDSKEVPHNKESQDEYLRQHKAEATLESKKERFSWRAKEDTREVHPMTCTATNEALGDQSVMYACPEDSLPVESKYTPDIPHNSKSGMSSTSKSVRRRDNSKNIKNRTGAIGTYLEGLSTLVKRLARSR